jgi:hypothetical protein
MSVRLLRHGTDGGAGAQVSHQIHGRAPPLAKAHGSFRAREPCRGRGDCAFPTPHKVCRVHWGGHILVSKGDICPNATIANHFCLNNPPPDAHIFAYKHAGGHRPLTCDVIWQRLKRVKVNGKPMLQFRALRIGDTLEYLLRRVPFAVVKVKGRWASNTFEVYLRKHAEIIAPNMADKHVACCSHSSKLCRPARSIQLSRQPPTIPTECQIQLKNQHHGHHWADREVSMATHKNTLGPFSSRIEPHTCGWAHLPTPNDNASIALPILSDRCSQTFQALTAVPDPCAPEVRALPTCCSVRVIHSQPLWLRALCSSGMTLPELYIYPRLPPHHFPRSQVMSVPRMQTSRLLYM